MSGYDLLLQQHADMIAAGNRLAEIVGNRVDRNLIDLTSARRTLANLVGRHFSDEDALIRAPLRRVQDPHVIKLVDYYVAEYTRVRLQRADHNGTWGLQAVQENWAGYSAAVRTRVAEMKRMIAWEERELYPAALKHLPSLKGSDTIRMAAVGGR